VRNLRAWAHQSSLKRIYRLPAYSCGYLHHLKQFYYSICAFLCLQRWGCVHTAFAALAPAIGGELAAVPMGASAVPAPAPGTWNCGWAAGIGVCVLLAYPVWWKMSLTTHFSHGHFYLAVPGILKEIPTSLWSCRDLLASSPCPGGGRLCGRWETDCAARCALVTLPGLFCWSCSAGGELGVCCRVTKGTLGWRIGQWSCGKKKKEKGDFGKRHFWDMCFSVGGTTEKLKLHVVALACTKARQSTGRELSVKHLISHIVKPQN